jgi:hypothetical protein
VTLNAGLTTVVNVVAVDPNGDAITLSVSGASFATLNAPTTGNGLVVTTLTLYPLAADVGPHTVTVTATANGETDTEDLLVQVNATGSNQAPVVVAPANETVNEGQHLSFTITATDADLTAINFLSVSGLPAGATFTNGVGNTSGTFSWTPTFTQAGSYDVGFIAANGLEGSAVTHIQVNNVAGGENHAPDVTAPATLSVNEGVMVSFTATATDADADHVTLTASGVPSGAVFTDLGNNTATLVWTPSLTAAGTYTITVTGNDGHGGTDTAVTTLTVLDVGGGNHAPDVTAPATLSVNEGVMVSFTATATDADADHVTLTASGVPSGAIFTDLGNNTATLVWTPSLSAAGTYTITMTGNDGHGGTDTAVTTLTVIDVGGGNNAPVLSVPATRTVSEGSTLTFNVSATDANGDIVNLTASGLPSGATFVDHDNNTGTFTWMPASDQSGTYTVTFMADDGHGGTDTETTMITVLDVTGGGEFEATAKLLGKIHRHRKNLCFKITPVSGSFDPAHVDLATITLNFDGGSVNALAHKTHIAFECHGDDDGDDDHDGDCQECGDRDDDHDDSGKWGDHRDQNKGQDRGSRNKWTDRDRQGTGTGGGDKRQWADGSNNQWDDPARGENDNDNGDGHDCDGDGHDDGDADSTGDCVGTSVHACFSMSDVRDLFGDASIADNIDDVTITGDLTTGGTFLATVNGHHPGNGHGKDKNKKHHHGAMSVQATPNPFNPQTILTFALTQSARVRVNIYDLRGALVKTLLNENRNAGTQTVPWDGTDSKQQRVVSGVYFVQVQSDQDRVVQRLTVLK